MKKAKNRLKTLDFRFWIFDFRFLISQIANQKSKIRNVFVSCVFLTSYVLYLVSSSYGDSSEEINYYSPENILKFAEHLYQEGDYLRAAGEYQRYLFYSRQDADSTLYKIGLCYRLAGDMGRAISSFNKIISEGTESRFRFAASYQIAYSYFLLDQYGSSVQYINQVLDETENADDRGKLQVLAAFNYLHQRQWRDAEHVLRSLALKDENLNHTASALRASAREGMSLPRKNPVLAGLFSAVLPGAGRIYCKQYGDGVYSLILVGVTGLLAWDGFRENGVRSVRGWLFGGISGIFYAGNVHGSTMASRIYNRQLEAGILKRLPVVPDN